MDNTQRITKRKDCALLALIEAQNLILEGVGLPEFARDCYASNLGRFIDDLEKESITLDP